MSFQLIPDITLSSTLFSATRSWYHEKLIGSDQLLICIGDSWTWGDSLRKDGISNESFQDDDNYRTAHIYGALLSSMMGADLLNLASCGSSNFKMYKHLRCILPKVVNRYKQIYLVITLTENGREFSTTSWPIRQDASIIPSDVDQLLEAYEQKMFEEFNQVLLSYTNIQTLIGRNFTFSYTSNLPVLQGKHLDKTWVEILAEQQQLSGYPNNLRMLTQLAYDPLIKYLKNTKLVNNYKAELFDMFSIMDDAINWLHNSALNYKTATCHPTEDAHQLWAEYLFKKLQ